MSHHKPTWENALNTRILIAASIFIQAILYYFYYFPETKLLLGDESRYLSKAIAITQGDYWHTNPLWPPLQSLLLALFVLIFDSPILPLQLFQSGLIVFTGFILRDIVYRETQSKASAQLALAIMIMFPSWLAYAQYLWPEVIHVFLFVSILWVLHYRFESIKWLLLSGLLIGLAVLFKSLLVLFVPFLYLNLMLKLPIKKAIASILLSLMIAFIVISPASYQANKITGGWMPSNSGMFNLWMGLNDDSYQHFTNPKGAQTLKLYNSVADEYEQRHHKFKQMSLEKIKQQGVVNTFVQQFKKQYFRLFDHQTFFSQQFKGDREDNFLNKYSHNYQHWLVQVMIIFDKLFYWLLMIGMVLGLMASLKRSSIAQVLALFLLYVLGLFFFLHAKPRFRIPLVPLMAFFTAFSVYFYFFKKQLDNSVLQQRLPIVTITLTVIVITILVSSAQLLDKYWPI